MHFEPHLRPAQNQLCQENKMQTDLGLIISGIQCLELSVLKVPIGFDSTAQLSNSGEIGNLGSTAFETLLLK